MTDDDPSPVYRVAHDLCANADWEETHGGFRLKRGRVVWELATYPDGANSSGTRVKIMRIGSGRGMLRGHVRYIDPDTEIELVNVRYPGDA